MMIPLLLLLALCLLPSTTNAQTCSNETCATFYNRTCSVNDDCTGPCLANYTDFANLTESCYDVREIDWEKFIQKFDPTFVAEDYTKEERLEILQKIAQYISEYNANHPGVKLGINKYSADTEEDLKAKTGYRYIEGSEDMLEEQQPIVGSTGSSGIPSKRDWVAEGAVTSVKDQGRCGCCWGISVAGAIEGAAAINSDFTYLQSVSFQQFISCDDQNYGCNGGNIVLAAFYAVKLNERGGIARLNDYPYTDEGGETTETCNLEPDRAVEANDGKVVVTFDDGRSYEERLERMKYALSITPISMVVKSTCRLFNNYRSGVVTDDEDCRCVVIECIEREGVECILCRANSPVLNFSYRCEDVSCIDHAVLLVAYNDEDSPPSFTIKNSWGTGWGEGGKSERERIPLPFFTKSTNLLCLCIFPTGYMRIAQDGGGRRWGLFGMLSEGVVALDVYNVTGQVYDEPQSTGSNLTNWQIALIAVAAFLAALLCCCGIMTLVKKK